MLIQFGSLHITCSCLTSFPVYLWVVVQSQIRFGAELWLYSDAFMFWLLSSPEHIDSSSLNILSILGVFLSVTCPLYVFFRRVLYYPTVCCRFWFSLFAASVLFGKLNVCPKRKYPKMTLVLWHFQSSACLFLWVISFLSFPVDFLAISTSSGILQLFYTKKSLSN